MNIGLIQFPGTNCERETTLAIKKAGMSPIDIFWNSPASIMNDMSGFVLVGGFSYEDRVRSGIMASQSWIVDALWQQASLGKPILGICNGAQILVESGLVPGIGKNQLACALTANRIKQSNVTLPTGYLNDYAYLIPFAYNPTHAFTNQLKPNQPIRVPYAHAEGCFRLDAAYLDALKVNECQLLHYCDPNGSSNSAQLNPNGSEFNLAAISNASGNVMAMMPHPERTDQGQVIFDSMRHYIAQTSFKEKRFSFNPSAPTQKPIKTPSSSTTTLTTQLIIEDNTAQSLQLLLAQHGYPCMVERYNRWHISGKEINLSELTDSGELYNSNKEQVVQSLSSQGLTYAIQDNDNIWGNQALYRLQHFFGMTSLHHITKETLYYFKCPEENKEALHQYLIQTHLLANPYSQQITEVK